MHQSLSGSVNNNHQSLSGSVNNNHLSISTSTEPSGLLLSSHLARQKRLSSEQNQPTERIQVLLTRCAEHPEFWSPIAHGGDPLVKVVEVSSHVRLVFDLFQLLESQYCAARRWVPKELAVLDKSNRLCANVNYVRITSHSISSCCIK